MKPSITVKPSPTDLQAIDNIVRQHDPFVRRHAVHLAALRLGLAELQAHPERLVEALRLARRTDTAT